MLHIQEMLESLLKTEVFLIILISIMLKSVEMI